MADEQQRELPIMHHEQEELAKTNLKQENNKPPQQPVAGGFYPSSAKPTQSVVAAVLGEQPTVNKPEVTKKIIPATKPVASVSVVNMDGTTAVDAPEPLPPANDSKPAKKRDAKRWLKLISYHPVKSGSARKKRYIPVERTVRVERVRITSTIIKFSKLYGPKRMSRCVLITIALGMLSGFISMLLVQNTGLYSFGIAALIQGFARLAFVDLALKGEANSSLPNTIYQLIFWLVYVLVNIPLMIFSWYKISKRFTILTIIYVVTMNATGFLLGLIPDINTISIFTDSNSLPLQSWLKDPHYTGNATLKNFIDDANKLNALRYVPVLWKVPYEAGRTVALLCYGILYAFCNSMLYTILYLMGGSSGGSDFFSEWFSRKKFKPVGSIMLYISTTLLIVGVLIGSYIPGSFVLKQLAGMNAIITNGNPSTTYVLTVDGWQEQSLATAGLVSDLAWHQSLYFSPNILGALIAAVLLSILMNLMYPRFNLAQLQIYSNKTMEIREQLLADSHPHAMSIQELLGGFSLDRRQAILTISMYKDLPRLIAMIRDTDSKCLIAVTRLRGIDGFMYVYQDQ